MKINLQEYLKGRPNIVEWAIIHLMTAKSPRLSEIPEFNPLYAGGKCDTASMDIEVKINGIEVNFVELLEWINKQNNVMVAEKAKELVNEKFSDLHDRFSSIIGVMDSLIKVEQDKLYERES